MTCRWLEIRWLMACILVLAAATAGAAETDTETDTGGSESDSTSDGTNSTAGDRDDVDDFGDESCGDCTAAATMTPSFQLPAAGAQVPTTFEVVTHATPECYCDDCGCGDGAVWRQRLLVDGKPMEVPMRPPPLPPADGWCMAATCTFEVTTTPGDHVITLEAEYTYEVVTATLAVSVVGDPSDDGSASAGSASGDPDDATSGSASDDTTGGCSCRTDTTAPPVFAWLLLLAVVRGRSRVPARAHRSRVRGSSRSVVEPRGRGSSHRSRASDRTTADRQAARNRFRRARRPSQ